MLTFNPNRLVATHNVFITAATHAGSCRCWRCLIWWSALAPTEGFAPFTAEERAAYNDNGLPFTVTFPKGEVALGVMIENQIQSDDPAIGDIDGFDALEKAAAACGWTIDHPYKEVVDGLCQELGV